MRLRLRAKSEVDYRLIVRSNDNWWEHQARTLATAGLIAFLKPETVLDLACGDGSLVFTAHKLHRLRKVTFCDISEPAIEEVYQRAKRVRLAGSATVIDAEERLDIAINNGEHWDLALACEFLEHIEDPVTILRKIGRVAQLVLASSPIIELPRGDPNHEHLWGFDNEGYGELLAEAGWVPKICENLMLRDGYYNFQMWVCGRG